MCLICVRRWWPGGHKTISPTPVKDLLMSHCVGILGTTTSSYPCEPFLVPLPYGWGEQFQHPYEMCPHLTALPKFSSVANAPALFPFFSQKVCNMCIYQKLSLGEQSCRPQVLPSEEGFSTWQCVIRNKCQQRARQDMQMGKNKITCVHFVWGVRQNSVGS